MDSQTAQKCPPKADPNALCIPEILCRIFDFLAAPIATLHDLKHLNETPMQPASEAHDVQCPCGRWNKLLIKCNKEDFPKAGLEEVKVCKSTLLAAATACRSFSGPALDALWKQMDSLVPLVSLLPLTSDGSGYLQMQNASQEDMDTFIAYSKRIRVFVYKHTSLLQGKGRTLHISVYPTLLASRGVLLPNLKVLLIPLIDRDALASEGIYFASPSLTTLEIGELKATTNALDTFLMTIGSRVEHLRHMSMGQSVVVSLPVWDRILSTKLRSIELFSPTLEVLEFLSSFPVLQELKVINLPKPASSLKFPSLERLSLDGTLTSVMYFLEDFQSPLDSISLTFQATSTSPPISELESIIKTISNRWKQSLARLSLDFGNKDIPGLDFAQDFQPFFSLPLHTFRILQYPKTLDSPTFLVETASRFPDIKYLQMPPHVAGQEPTIDDLRAVSQSCPSLRMLSTSINSGSDRALRLPPFSRHELEELHVYASPIDNPKKLAAQLDRIFPYLRKVTTSSPTHLKNLNEVERLLELCHEARRGFF